MIHPRLASRLRRLYARLAHENARLLALLRQGRSLEHALQALQSEDGPRRAGRSRSRR